MRVIFLLASSKAEEVVGRLFYTLIKVCLSKTVYKISNNAGYIYFTVSSPLRSVYRVSNQERKGFHPFFTHRLFFILKLLYLDDSAEISNEYFWEYKNF